MVAESNREIVISEIRLLVAWEVMFLALSELKFQWRTQGGRIYQGSRWQCYSQEHARDFSGSIFLKHVSKILDLTFKFSRI